MIISFANTLKALIEFQKTHTRRVWSHKHHQMVKGQLEKGNYIHDGYSKIPIQGGIVVGKIFIKDLYLESLNEMPACDVAKEGFPDMTKDEFMKAFFRDVDPNKKLSVVSFKPIKDTFLYETVFDIRKAEDLKYGKNDE